MLILGIETSTNSVSCALWRDGSVVADVSALQPRRHAEALAPALRSAATTAGVALGQLDGVAVGLGPGLFTGLRVGMATAKAMAFALGVPLVGRCSLDLVAHPLRSNRRPVLVALDARRGELFWSVHRFDLDDDAGPSMPRVGPPDEVGRIARELAAADPRGVLVVGDGVLRVPEAFSAEGIECVGAALAHPQARVLVEMTHAELAARRAEGTDAVAVRVDPIYVRDPDAVANWRERDRVVGGA
ncbi:MAG: tRNA (adenosine(37)-N6)-threonylcarbamoyltransferase complex dimerization subunit type 1 TsaB [Acidimicrobiia bacterium]|nr:tRNA (adenosine(37)-N6)-threonylcarbamoyltransferase complex dimerization subunit type 1 TsaB [Acidimicrobiia bacterium]